jgi:hypothetical protein
MLNKEWINAQIAEAYKANPNVNNTIIEHITQLLYSQLTEQLLTSAELKNISITLLQETGLHLPETAGKQ